MKLNSAILLFISVFLFSNCSSRRGGESFLGDIDLNDTLARKKIVADFLSYASFISFAGALDEFGTSGPEDYSAEDEGKETRYTLPDILQKSDFINMDVSQYLDYPGSIIDIDLINDNDEYSLRYTLDSIYFNSGTSLAVGKRSSGSYELSDMQIIDSIKISIDYTYTTDVSEVILTKQQAKATLDNGTIKLSKIDRNMAEYTISNELSYDHIITLAVTPSDNMVGTKSYSYGGMPANKQRKHYKKISKEVLTLAQKVKSQNTDQDKLIGEIIKIAKRTEEPESDVRYHQAFFRGNIAKLALYFKADEATTKYSVTLPVKSDIGTLNLIEVNDHWGIVDNNGSIILEPSLRNISAINSYFYTSEDYYGSRVFHLDMETKALDTLIYKPRNISRLTDNLVSLSYKHKTGVLNEKAELIIPIEYHNIEKIEEEDLLVAWENRSNFTLYDLNGKKLISGRGDGDLEKFRKNYNRR